MSEITIQKLSNKQREQIRWMYLADYQITDIVSKMNLDMNTVRMIIFGLDGAGKDKSCVHFEKKHASSAIVTAFLMDKASVLDGIAGVAIKILKRSLDKLYDKDEELSVDEMTKIAGIVTSLDKIVRLESGMDTETIEYKGLSMAEAREIIANDPFANAIEIESVEVLPWLK